MKNSHRDIVAKHLKHSLLRFLQREEKFEKFENGDTKIVSGKRETEEVKPLINFST